MNIRAVGPHILSAAFLACLMAFATPALAQDMVVRTETTEKIPADASDLFGVFSRYRQSDCVEDANNPPAFADLEIIEAPTKGTIIDFGTGLVEMANGCVINSRIIVYKSASDFTGEDRVTIGDPTIGHVKTNIYNHDDGKWIFKAYEQSFYDHVSDGRPEGE